MKNLIDKLYFEGVMEAWQKTTLLGIDVASVYNGLNSLSEGDAIYSGFYFAVPLATRAVIWANEKSREYIPRSSQKKEKEKKYSRRMNI